jgi:hypothetical protein
MVAGVMIFIFALMFFVLVTLVYSAISKLKRKGGQSRRLHRKPVKQDPHGKQEVPGFLDPADSERSQA